MRTLAVRSGVACLALLALLAVGSAAAKAANPVVVLKGGEVIALKEPYTIKGSNAILVRTDGTMFSVPVSEIDQKATKARMAAPRSEAAPAAVSADAETPAEAARSAGTRPRARVRLTDADVGHQPAPEGEEGSEAAAAGSSSTGTPAKVEVADYTQDKAGNQFVVRGNLRNVGASTASGVRMTVFLVNEKGDSFTRREAGLATTTIEAGHTISFSAAFDTGGQNVNGVRFQPIWVAAPVAAPAGGAGGGSSGASAGSNGSKSMSGAPPAPSPAAAPQPVPTPYGRGLLWAPGAPPASDKPPADGTNGYLPGAARPEDQPKPPQ